MITRRRLLIATLSIPTMGVVLAKSSDSQKSNPFGQHLKHVFRNYLADPDIHAAMSKARQSHTVSTTDIDAMLFECTGCSAYNQSDAIVLGFRNKKNKSLQSFQVTNVEGYMLTPEEQVLGQLLAQV